MAAEETARVEAEQRLRRSEEHLRLAAEAAKLGTFEVDLQAQRVLRSPRMAEMVGRGGQLDVSFEEAFADTHPDDRALVRTLLEASGDPNGPERLEAEARVVQPDGRVVWHRYTTRKIVEDTPTGRRPTRVIGTALDAVCQIRPKCPSRRVAVRTPQHGVLDPGRVERLDEHETALSAVGVGRDSPAPDAA